MIVLEKEYFAHTAPLQGGDMEPLREHLSKVANRASEYADAFGASDEAALAGLLHDLGKYGGLFQDRLKGKESGIDHWSMGAWVSLTRYKQKGIAAALAIQGHHVGLREGDADSLRMLNPEKLRERERPRLSEPDPSVLIQRMQEDGLAIPKVDSIERTIYERSASETAAGMLDVRMLYSALVDADFIETEAHFNAGPDGLRNYRGKGPYLEPEKGLKQLLGYLEELSKRSSASLAVNALRNDLLDSCLLNASSEPGLFTLTAPTGSGKTLSMLAFALKHSKNFELRRIITVIPYLSIIDQTVREYRKVFEPVVGPKEIGQYILEHDSMAGTRGKSDGDIPDYLDRERLLAENWDAPMIVTTSVQFLESLFSNRSSSCRKLHRLAKSVILFDEVQTLPMKLAIPTLATLSRLAERYGSTVVFSTATQPAFSHLGESVRKYCSQGWEPKEIVPDNMSLFNRINRTDAKWPVDVNATISWEELAEQVALPVYEQSLCIVNVKKHALALYQALKGLGADGLFHLSTSLCPVHRDAVLKEVWQRLERKKPCRLVSTQCVEAGVDLDFPAVFRALAPLDSVAQAAGRCNRNGLLDRGEVHLFIPQAEGGERIYPDGAYEQAAGVTRILLNRHGSEGIDINDPEIYKEYFLELYGIARPELLNKELLEAIRRYDFPAVSERYRIIENDAINILVAYDSERFHELADEVRESGLRRGWIAKARPHTVSLFRPRHKDPIYSYIEAIPVDNRKREYSNDWFIYLFDDHYDKETGLNPPQAMECLIG